jgi:hypothetical protein
MVNRFENDWAKGLGRAVNVFVTLISEGSQADRERFIKEFEFYYDKKYQKTQADLKAGGFVTQTSEGGTTLFLDARKTVAVLNIPSTTTLKTEIYRQTFKVMGDEWASASATNSCAAMNSSTYSAAARLPYWKWTPAWPATSASCVRPSLRFMAPMRKTCSGAWPGRRDMRTPR